MENKLNLWQRTKAMYMLCLYILVELLKQCMVVCIFDETTVFEMTMVHDACHVSSGSNDEVIFLSLASKEILLYEMSPDFRVFLGGMLTMVSHIY